MLDKFTEILNRPGVEAALHSLLNREDRARERRKDSERDKLRRQREALVEELALGRAALVAGVREADVEVAAAEEALRLAQRKRRSAARELSALESSLSHRVTRIDAEIARRPIGILAELRARLTDARRALGAPPRWVFEKNPDRSYWRRADELGRVEREIQRLETTSSATAEAAAPGLERELDYAIRGA